MNRKVENTVNALLQEPIKKLGYELVGCEYTFQYGKRILRLYIDKDGNTNLNDCQKVMAYAEPLLNVEEIVNEKFSLEVSSPGLNRPLFTIEHFKKHVGDAVKIKMHSMVEGRRNFTGKIDKVEESSIKLLVDEHYYTLPWADIDKANLISDIKL